MKFSKLFAGLFAATLLFNVACKDDEVFEDKGTFDKGYLITNEGSFTHNNAEVSFVSDDLATVQNDIYKTTNANEPLGDVLQSIAFDGVNAYLVVNNSNKIQVVNRYGFKKLATITSNLQGPRNIAFAGNYMYVTNNNFFSSYYVSIYNKSDLSFVKKMTFDRYAEKIVEASGNVLVQTDGVSYSTGSAVVTGHSISILKSSNNELLKEVTLPDSGEIKDLGSKDGFGYALSSTYTDSYLYKINALTGDVTNIALAGVAGAEKMRISGDTFYFLDGLGNVYAKSISANTAATKIFTIPYYVYGFDIVDGKIFASDAKDFSSASEVNVYSLTGQKLKTFNTGVAASNFYKN